MALRLKSKRRHKRPDIWVTEISVKDRNATPQIKKLIKLVERYESLS